MTTLKLLNGKGNAAEERFTADVIMRGYGNPDELMLKTIEAAKQREKENAARNALKKKVYMRVAAVAALIVIVLAATPAGGYVASAAESAWHAFQTWLSGAFSVTVEKTVNDCTIEIVEARVSNNCLYLLVTEDYNKVYDESDCPYDIVPAISGRIYDNEGHSCEIRSDYVSRGDTGSEMPVTEEGIHELTEDGAGGKKYYRKKFELMTRAYKIFIPDLGNVVNSEKKKYYCDLRFDVSLFHDREDSEKIAALDFDFPIKNVEGAFALKECKLDYSYTVGDMLFDFRKITLWENSCDVMVELTPLNGLAAYNLINDGKLDISATAIIKNPNEKPRIDEDVIDLSVASVWYEHNVNDIWFSTYSSFFDEEGAFSKSNNVYKIGEKYYVFLSYGAEGLNSRFSYDDDSPIKESMEQRYKEQYEKNLKYLNATLGKDTEMEVIGLSYLYTNQKDSRRFSGDVCVRDDLIVLNDSAKKTHFKELTFAKKWIYPDWVGSEYEEKFGDQNERYQKPDYSISFEKIKASVPEVFIYYSPESKTNKIRITTETHTDDEKQKENEGIALVYFSKLRFVVKHKNKVLSYSNENFLCSWDEGRYETDGDYSDFEMDTGDISVPDSVLPVYVEYFIHGKRYTYYDPRYCDINGLTKAEAKSVKKQKADWSTFKTHNTFTVSDEYKTAR